MGCMGATDRLGWILDLVEQSLEHPDMSGDELASRAYLSRFHFDRLVAAALGEPPGALRRRLLLERAAHRLTGSDDPGIEIAFESGYGSSEAFARAFGRAFGAAPSLHRQKRGGHLLPSPSGVHFHPPGGLRLPPTTRSTTMDVLTRMIDHHLWLV